MKINNIEKRLDKDLQNEIDIKNVCMGVTVKDLPVYSYKYFSMFADLFFLRMYDWHIFISFKKYILL